MREEIFRKSIEGDIERLEKPLGGKVLICENAFGAFKPGDAIKTKKEEKVFQIKLYDLPKNKLVEDANWSEDIAEDFDDFSNSFTLNLEKKIGEAITEEEQQQKKEIDSELGQSELNDSGLNVTEEDDSVADEVKADQNPKPENIESAQEPEVESVARGKTEEMEQTIEELRGVEYNELTEQELKEKIEKIEIYFKQVDLKLIKNEELIKYIIETNKRLKRHKNAMKSVLETIERKSKDIPTKIEKDTIVENIDKYFERCKKDGVKLRVDKDGDQTFVITKIRGNTIYLKNTGNGYVETSNVKKDFLYEFNREDSVDLEETIEENGGVVNEVDFLEEQIEKLKDLKDPALKYRREELIEKRNELTAKESEEARQVEDNQKSESEPELQENYEKLEEIFGDVGEIGSKDIEGLKGLINDKLQKVKELKNTETDQGKNVFSNEVEIMLIGIRNFLDREIKVYTNVKEINEELPSQSVIFDYVTILENKARELISVQEQETQKNGQETEQESEGEKWEEIKKNYEKMIFDYKKENNIEVAKERIAYLEKRKAGKDFESYKSMLKNSNLDQSDENAEKVLDMHLGVFKKFVAESEINSDPEMEPQTEDKEKEEIEKRWVLVEDNLRKRAQQWIDSSSGGRTEIFSIFDGDKKIFLENFGIEVTEENEERLSSLAVEMYVRFFIVKENPETESEPAEKNIALEKIKEWQKKETHLRTKERGEQEFIIDSFREGEDNDVVLKDKYGHRELIGREELYKLNIGKKIAEEEESIDDLLKDIPNAEDFKTKLGKEDGEKLEEGNWDELNSFLEENFSRTREAYEKSDDKDEFVDSLLGRYNLETNKNNKEKLKNIIETDMSVESLEVLDELERTKELFKELTEEYKKAVEDDDKKKMEETAEKIRMLGSEIADEDETEPAESPEEKSAEDEPKKFELNESRKESLRKTNEMEGLMKENEDILFIPDEDLTDEQRKIRDRINELKIGIVLDESSAIFTDHIRNLEGEVGKPQKEGILGARERCERSFELLNATKMLKMGLEMKMQGSKKQRRIFPSVGKLGNAIKEKLKSPFGKKEKVETDKRFSKEKRKDLNLMSEEALEKEFKRVLSSINNVKAEFGKKNIPKIRVVVGNDIGGFFDALNSEIEKEKLKPAEAESFIKVCRKEINDLPEGLGNSKEYLLEMIDKVDGLCKKKFEKKKETLTEEEATEATEMTEKIKLRTEIIEQLKDSEEAVQELGKLVGLASFVDKDEKIGKFAENGMEDNINNEKLREIFKKEGIKDLTVKEVKEIYDELKTYRNNLDLDLNDKADNQAEIETTKSLEISRVLLANGIKIKDLDEIIKILDLKLNKAPRNDLKSVKVESVKNTIDNKRHKKIAEDILQEDEDLSIIDLKNIIEDVKTKK